MILYLRNVAGLLLLTAGLLACSSQAVQVDSASPVEAAPAVAEAEAIHRKPASPPGLQQTLTAVYSQLLQNRDGELYSGAVAGTRIDDLAIAVVTVDGEVHTVGADTVEFPLMSVSKPFTYAVAVEQRGVEAMLEKVGMNATGMPYNSMAGLVSRPQPLQNPLVNTGAIATHSYIEGPSSDSKLQRVIDVYSALAGRPLAVVDAWRATPRASSYALAYQMQHYELLEGDVDDTLQRYLLSNIVAVNVVDLARMGATLANSGIQPNSSERVLKRETVRAVLSAMVNAGMYEDSGLWWAEVGMPAKSGVSGAIVAIAPGWGAIAAYSPRLDGAGNSVRAGLAIRQLSASWGLHSMDRLLVPTSGAK
jgi:glutaminase